MELEKLENMNKKAKELKEKIIKAEAQLKKLREALKSSCIHDEIFLREVYHSGTYDDHAYTDTITVCSVCEKYLKTETEMHSWFG